MTINDCVVFAAEKPITTLLALSSKKKEVADKEEEKVPVFTLVQN